ncbi:MAG TPA: molybdopterin-dependent oxidoreductase, partial [Bacteroidales bacterium]
MIFNEAKKYKSTCSFCGVGCGILISRDSLGRLQVEGDPEHPANKGMLCSKGKSLNHIVENQDDRLLYPEMKWAKNMPRIRVSWDTALNRTAAVFKTLTDKFGPDAVGFYVSGQLLTEEYYVVNKLAKGFIRTNNIDTNSRLCMSSAVVGYKLSLGEDSVPLTYDDIELADCFLISGANPAWCHPILFRRLEKHKNENPEIKIIVSDPRRTQSAAMADLHLQIQPGTDIYLHHGIARWLIEHNFTDKSFIEAHTNGFDSLRDKVMQYTLDDVAAICKIEKSGIELAAKWIGESKGFISMWAMGLNQSVIGVDKNLSLINLSLLTGKIGKPGNGPLSLTGQPNAMGGREVGGLCNLLPAHRNMDNPEHREEVARFWGVSSIPDKPGYTATQMFEALAEDKLKAIWIICTNPLISLPNVRLVEEALRKARFVVVQDISNNSVTREYADVVLPAAGWAEKEGTMTNSDRRISYLSKVIDAPGEARPDAEIIIDFANRMNFQGFNYKSNADIYAEHAKLTEGTRIDISGLTYQRLMEGGTVQWPYPKNATEGTPRLFTDHQFYTPDKHANIYAPDPENLSAPVSKEHPFILTSGRIRDQWHTMTRTGKVSKLRQHIAEAFVEINTTDAKRHMISEGQLVEVLTVHGDARLKAKITDEIKEGVIFVPMHWGKILESDLVRVNNLTSSRIDARSKEPDFKFTAARVKPYAKPKEKIVVVGAGAAAFKFVSTLRNLNGSDEIHVFSDEKYPFYNRVLLPDYITGSKSWEQLQKLNEKELHSLKLEMHTSTNVKSIDRHRKIIMDSYHVEHTYDKLILATGSKPNVPSNVNMNMEGLFTVRNREDAERIINCIHPEENILLVGAGLLSLEMVAALHENNVRVNLVNRVNRLMSRQLDKVASTLLRQIIEEHGAKLYLNDEIENIFKREKGELEVVLKSGYRIMCKAVIFAIGTTPNTELAKECGLRIQRGVVVNGHLQTNDPDIFAIGEIAEYNDMLYGITTAAEEQAEAAARFISGDITGVFTGSVSMNILKYPGLDVCSIGIAEPPVDDGSFEEIIFFDKAARYYKKCIIHNNMMVGAILFGDRAEFAEYRDLIKQKTELSEKRMSLLRSGKPARPLLGKVVCSCNTVGEGNLVEEIRNKVIDFEQLCTV